MTYVLVAARPEAIVTRLRSFAREIGVDVLIAADGVAAVEALQARGLPRLMLVDLTLARLDGFAVIRELRALAAADSVPVVAVSSFSTLLAHARRLQSTLGITAVVSSSVDGSELDQVLHGALAMTDPVIRIALDDPAELAAREQARLAEVDAMADIRPSEDVIAWELASIAHQFGVRTVLVTLVDQHHVVFKAAHGLPRELAGMSCVPRSESFCRHVVESDAPSPLIVPDAANHPAFSNNPLVLAGAIGSYVGVPLTSPRGSVLGTLCIVDPLPWLGSAALVDSLVTRARHVTTIVLDRCGTSSETWRESSPMHAPR